MVYVPRAVHARISARCNLACDFCERELLPGPRGRVKTGNLISFSDGRPPLDLTRDMPEEVWEAVVARMMPHTDRMELGGLGEPTIAPLFPRAAREVVAAGKELFFFTNGLTLDRVVDCVGERPSVSVSIDAGTPEGYKANRGGSLRRLEQSVRAFRRGVPRARLSSQYTATARNIGELPEFVRLCAKLGIGRTGEGELSVVGADHHVTDRVALSVRFARDATARAIDEAREVAEAEGLWLVNNLPPASDANPNAITDGSDPRNWRRYTDTLYGDENNPCAPIGSTGVVPPPEAPRPQHDGFGNARVVVAPREVYVDYNGDVWSCLARHHIGDVLTQDWRSIIEENDAYQQWLANWANGIPNANRTCMTCPRLK